jgi:hypothetical protein
LKAAELEDELTPTEVDEVGSTVSVAASLLITCGIVHRDIMF